MRRRIRTLPPIARAICGTNDATDRGPDAGAGHGSHAAVDKSFQLPAKCSVRSGLRHATQAREESPIAHTIVVPQERAVGFWFLNRIIVAELFFTNRKRQEAGRSGCSTGKEEDPITRVYGTAAPSSSPESTDWWKKQQRDLFAISDEAELGLMQTMVTVTANDASPEMLATIRRGPLATPTEK